ncbi:HAD-IA family hydrolase [Candidatus Dojkabacteria bacterium]|nr:HAD-IA family hydrolase [Candidatus Dojkabacteria bacterium]
MKYGFAFIDLDDTVFNSKSLYDQAIYMAWEHFRKFYEDIDYPAFEKTFLDTRTELKEEFKHLTISHNRAILFGRLLEKFEIPFNAELIQDLYDTYWFAVNVHIQPFPGVLKTLESLKEDGVRLLALSDGSLLSRLEKINSLKMSKHFDYLVSSEEVVYTKPKPQIFELAMQKAEVQDKKEILFVGNSYSADVIGGKSFGVDTCWFNLENEKISENVKYKPDYQISDFTEILKIMEG